MRVENLLRLLFFYNRTVLEDTTGGGLKSRRCRRTFLVRVCYRQWSLVFVKGLGRKPRNEPRLFLLTV